MLFQEFINRLDYERTSVSNLEDSDTNNYSINDTAVNDFLVEERLYNSDTRSERNSSANEGKYQVY